MGLLGSFQYFFDEEPLVVGLCCCFDEELQKFFDLGQVASVGDQHQVDLLAFDGVPQYFLPKGFDGVEQHFEVRKTMEEVARVVLDLAFDVHVGDETQQVEEQQTVVELREGQGGGTELGEFAQVFEIGVGFGDSGLEVFMVWFVHQFEF